MPNVRYVVFSLLAALLVTGAVVAHFFPAALMFAGADVQQLLATQRVYLLVAGLGLGGVNAWLGCSGGRERNNV